MDINHSSMEILNEQDGIATSFLPLLEKSKQTNNIKVKIENDERTNSDKQLPNSAGEIFLRSCETINENTENEINAGTLQVSHGTQVNLPVNGVSVNKRSKDSMSRLGNSDSEQEEGEIMDSDEEQELITDITLEKDPQTLPSTSTARLRVKSEFSTRSFICTPHHTLPSSPTPTSTPPPSASQPPEPPTSVPDDAVTHISEDFFSDLLTTDQIGVPMKQDVDGDTANGNHKKNNDIGYSNSTNATESCQRIPENFFDELLTPSHATSASYITNGQEQEIKYSEYLPKSQNELTYAEEVAVKRNKAHNTSQKRNHDDGNDNDSDRYNTCDARKRHCAFEGQRDIELNHTNGIGTTSMLSRIHVKREPGDDGDTSMGSMEHQSFSLDPITSSNNDTEEIALLTPKEKGNRAVQCVLEVLKILKQYPNNQMPSPLQEYGFLYTRITCKLPSNESCLNQKSYGNGALLHNKNNVNYKFNSLIWPSNNSHNNDLELLSPAMTRLARILCYDVYALKDKMKEIKLPAKLQQIKNMLEEQQQLEHKILENSSTFCNSTTTQTEADDFKLLGVNVGLDNRNDANIETVDIAIQVQPKVGSIAIQATNSAHNTDLEDLPIIQIIRKLNDNQLMALHDFAELISEPGQASNAMDMYRVRQRMLDIYKSSQIPSVIQHNSNYKHTQHISLSNNDSPYLSFRNHHISRHNNCTPSTESSTPLLSSYSSTIGPKFYGRGGHRRQH